MTDAVPRQVAVFDVGKTHAKVCLVDTANRRILDERRTVNAVRQTGPYPHFDTDALWAFLLDGLSDLRRVASVDALSVTAHGAAGVLIGTDDLALPVMDYEFAGPDALAADYDAVRPDFAETGSPRLPGGLNLGAQLFWQAREMPADVARAAALVTYPQYWTWRLTGTAATEVTSLGCHTDLWNPALGQVSSLVDRLGLTGRVAPLASAVGAGGRLTPALARHLGLPGDLPVASGIHDSNGSLFPHLADRRPPFAMVSTGTWVVMFAVGGRHPDLDPRRDTLLNVDAYGRPVPSARFMGGREFEIGTDGTAAIPTADTLRRILETGLQICPSIVSGSGPFPDAASAWRRGGEPVDPDALSADQRHGAASLYAALMTQVSLDLIGADGPILVDGPFAGNAAYLIGLARFTGRPVHAVAATGPAIGAALLLGIPQTDRAPDTLQHDTVQYAAGFAEIEPALFDRYRDDWHRR